MLWRACALAGLCSGGPVLWRDRVLDWEDFEGILHPHEAEAISSLPAAKGSINGHFSAGKSESVKEGGEL